MGIRSISLTLLLTAGAAMASADTISFGSLSQAGSTYASEGGSYSQDGFTLSSQSSAFYIWEASSPNLPGTNTADTSLFEFYAYSTTTLSHGGSEFSLDSIDLAPLIAGGSGTFTVTFTGTFADLSTVSQTVTVGDGTPPELQTFDLTGFDNVESVTFTQGTNSGFFETQDTGYQFDNLVVSAGAVSTPEPSSVPFVSISLLGLIAVSIKRSVSRQAVSKTL